MHISARATGNLHLRNHLYLAMPLSHSHKEEAALGTESQEIKLCSIPVQELTVPPGTEPWTSMPEELKSQLRTHRTKLRGKNIYFAIKTYLNLGTSLSSESASLPTRAERCSKIHSSGIMPDVAIRNYYFFK